MKAVIFCFVIIVLLISQNLANSESITSSKKITIDTVYRRFQREFDNIGCGDTYFNLQELSDSRQPKEYNLQWQSYFNEQKKAQLFQFSCNRAAYNTNSVFYLVFPDGRIISLSFSTVKTDKEGNILGYGTTDILFKPEYDEEKEELTTLYFYRGLGDASISATYRFVNGSFILKKYEVDQTFDGEINPQTIVDIKKAY